MSSGTYRGTKPTPPLRRAVDAPRAEDSGNDGAETHQRCPLCMGAGMIPPALATAFEAFCRKLHEDQ